MKAPAPTYDLASNEPEQIQRVAKAVGTSALKSAVFNAVYYHKAQRRTVAEIVQMTGLDRIQVLKAGAALRGVAFDQEKHSGDIAYVKRFGYQRHKRQILRLAADRRARDALVTKRNSKVTVKLPKSVLVPTTGAKVKRIYIDDVREFAKAKKVKGDAKLPQSVSEKQFKEGIQRIIGEPGVFTDWGGERSDLYTTRLSIGGKRRSAAFAFKGPGLKRKLILKNMGKNGDQLPRLFQEDADVYLIQHWREIDPVVSEMMGSLAVAKSVTTGKQIWFGTIDGKDSHRLYLAYPDAFARRARRQGKTRQL